MKNRNCCGDSLPCDIQAELPDDYIDTLYDIYVRECKESNKDPLSKDKWLKTIAN